MKLKLNQALAEGRLAEFVAQAEAEGVGPGDRAAFDASLERLIKAPQQEGRTSRSRARGGSRGK
jgi:hypothetical protein